MSGFGLEAEHAPGKRMFASLAWRGCGWGGAANVVEILKE